MSNSAKLCATHFPEARKVLVNKPLQKVITNFYEVARHAWVTEVTNHFRKMLRSLRHKAAEHTPTIRMNSDKLTDPNS